MDWIIYWANVFQSPENVVYMENYFGVLRYEMNALQLRDYLTSSLCVHISTFKLTFLCAEGRGEEVYMRLHFIAIYSTLHVIALESFLHVQTSLHLATTDSTRWLVVYFRWRDFTS